MTVSPVVVKPDMLSKKPSMNGATGRNAIALASANRG